MKDDENRATSSKVVQFRDIFQEFRLESYSGLDNNRLAAFTLSLLADRGIPTSQENLIVAVFLMFPVKFSLVGFPEYPDAERVGRSLLQLGPKYRNWATGNRQVGYVLTEQGQLIVAQTKKLLENPESVKERRVSPRQRTREPDAEIKEIENTKLFQDFKSSKIESSDEFGIWELLRAFPSSPKKALRERLKRMKEAAKLAERKDVDEFLRVIEQRFSSILEEERAR